MEPTYGQQRLQDSPLTEILNKYRSMENFRETNDINQKGQSNDLRHTCEGTIENEGKSAER